MIGVAGKLKQEVKRRRKRRESQTKMDEKRRKLVALYDLLQRAQNHMMLMKVFENDEDVTCCPIWTHIKCSPSRRQIRQCCAYPKVRLKYAEFSIFRKRLCITPLLIIWQEENILLTLSTIHDTLLSCKTTKGPFCCFHSQIKTSTCQCSRPPNCVSVLLYSNSSTYP